MKNARLRSIKRAKNARRKSKQRANRPQPKRYPLTIEVKRNWLLGLLQRSQQRANRPQPKRYPLTIEDPFGGRETVYVNQEIHESADTHWNKLTNQYKEYEAAGALKTYRDAQGKIAVIKLPDEKEFKRNWMLGLLHGQKASEMSNFYKQQYFNVSAATAHNILFAQYDYKDNKDDKERKSSLLEYVKKKGSLSSTYWNDYGQVGERVLLNAGGGGGGFQDHSGRITLTWDSGASDEANIARLETYLRNFPRRAIMALHVEAFGKAGVENYKETVSNYDSD